MKKALALICVLAMALALCLPVFAAGDAAVATGGQAATGGQVPEVPEDATPAEKVEILADALVANPTNEAVAVALVSAITADKDAVVDADVTQAMLIALTNNDPIVMDNSDDPWTDGTICTVIYPASVGAELTVTLENKLSENKMLLSAEFEGGVQSPMGVYFSFTVPKGMDTSKEYMWINDDGQTGAVLVFEGKETNTVEFFAPHFSNYEIAPAEEILAKAAAGETAAAPFGASSSVSAPAATEAPILKSTGADMNGTLAIVLALASVLTVGSAVVLKKRVLGK